MRIWCYNPSIWQNLTASRDEIQRRKSRLRQRGLLLRIVLAYTARHSVISRHSRASAVCEMRSVLFNNCEVPGRERQLR